MSTTTDLAEGLQDLVATLRGITLDPAAQITLLAPLARFTPGESPGGGTVGRAMATMQAAVGAACRRAALVAMARAAAASAPASYDEAVALRDQLCGLLEAEELVAGDLGDDASLAALRALRGAVQQDLTRRAADLETLRTVSVPGTLPALVHAYRLYRDIDRAEQLAAYAGAEDLNFMSPAFQALGQ
ncbi:hypothetical protein [Teichococcus aestuarii]|uniref:hypothetical protein n=1 Tax=Teichococcus aestuarii TaxID=568898 RepID=UPI003622760B